MRHGLLSIFAGLAFATIVSSTANAVTIGVFSGNNAAQTNGGAIVIAQGHSFVSLSDLSAASISTLDIIWYMNSDNGSQGQSGNAAAISNFVSGGGVFVMNDREVDNAEGILPGGVGFNIIRNLTIGDSDINIINATTGLTSGPGGTLNDSSLDGGNSSTHGFAVAGSLPVTSVQILSRGNAAEIVDFTYEFGAGDVHYSTIPLDFYVGGEGGIAAFQNVYAPNLINYAVSLFSANVNTNAVPEPGAIALFGFGILGLGWMRRRRLHS